jgi:transposase
MRSEYIVHQPAASVIQLRQEWFREYQALGNARETCTRFGISRKTFYKWLKRFKNSGGNPSSLADLPRTPHHSPRRTSNDIRALVLDLRNTTGFGPRRLGRELRQEKGIQLSERTIWKIIRSGSPLVGTNDEPQPAFSLETMNQVRTGV